VTEAPGRSASINWLELFFDLAVVAAVSVLVDGLHGRYLHQTNSL